MGFLFFSAVLDIYSDLMDTKHVCIIFNVSSTSLFLILGRFKQFKYK